MPEAFIERFCRQLKDFLGDPVSSYRVPRQAMLDALYAAQRSLWDDISAGAGAQSILGRAEATITLTDDQQYYRLPGAFRVFFGFERRAGDGTVLARLGSLGQYDPMAGVTILKPQQQIMVQPTPTGIGSQDWTLIFAKGEVATHYARAKTVTDRSVVAGEPPAGAGQIVRVANYYAGSMLRIWQATTGAPQEMEIAAYSMEGDDPVFHLRHAFAPKPTGDVWYEICPLIDYPLDEIYATEAAVKRTGPKSQLRRRAGLLGNHRRLFATVLSELDSPAADRPRQTITVPDDLETDPYGV